MRAQVLARIAVHRSFLAQVPEAEVRAIADEAVAMARRVGRAQPLAAALTGALHARWRPGRAADRLELAAELIELTEAHDQITCAADAHVWRAGALLELGRLDEADAHLARHAELAEASQQPALLLHRDGMRAMRAALEGDYERGARIAREMFERGEREEADGRLLSPIHAQFHGAITLSLLNERGELGPHAPVFERLARQIAPPGGGRRSPGRTCRPAGPEPARELIEEMSAAASRRRRATATSPRGSAQVAHVVAELGDAELAAPVEPLLAPFAEFWVVLGPARVHARADRLQRRRDAAAAGPARRRGGVVRARRSSARGRCARGPTRRARRPGSPPRCAGSARTPAPRSSRRGPPRPRASSGWCACERELALASAAA